MPHCLQWLIPRGAIALAVGLIAAPHAQAAFHLWQFTEIFSNEDGSVQFIEMRSPLNGEHFVAAHSLNSAANTFQVPTNLPSSQTSNRFMLFGTSGFAALSGAVPPDYIIPDNFFNPDGDSLRWAGLDTLTFTAGQLPLDGLLSLQDNLTTAVNTPTNFAGSVGQIDITPQPVPGDTDDDGDVDLDDLNAVRNNFGSAGDPVPGDTAPFDGVVNLDDLNAVRNNFGASGSNAVPEPSSGATAFLLALGCGAVTRHRRRAGRASAGT